MSLWKRKKGVILFITALCLLVGGSFLNQYRKTGGFSMNFSGNTSVPGIVIKDGKRKSYADQNQVLKELGMEGLSEDELELLELERAKRIHQLSSGNMDFYELYGMDGEAFFDSMEKPYITLLQLMGMGEFDPDTWEYLPSSSEVYAFDCEIMNIDQMYPDFMKGISAISKNEFTITEARQDSSQVDVETGMGTYVFTFLYNGHPYLFEGEANYDWIDIRIIDFMNDVFKKEGNPKRLLCTSDGGQGYLVFYNTPKWGKQFTKKTSCTLSQSSS